MGDLEIAFKVRRAAVQIRPCGTGAFISCRQANRKSWIMISNEMRAERGMDSIFCWFEPQRLQVNL
jgi:hypothetical protein